MRTQRDSERDREIRREREKKILYITYTLSRSTTFSQGCVFTQRKTSNNFPSAVILKVRMKLSHALSKSECTGYKSKQTTLESTIIFLLYLCLDKEQATNNICK